MVFPERWTISQLHDKEGYFVRKKVTEYTKILELTVLIRRTESRILVGIVKEV